MMSGLLGGLYLAASAPGGEAGFANEINVILVRSTVIVLAIVLAVAFLGRKGTGLVPHGWGAIFEHIYDWIDDLAQGMMGRQGRKYVPFAMSLFLFVLASNWSGLITMPAFSHGAEHAPAAHGAPAHGESPAQVEEALGEAAAVDPAASAHPIFEAPSVSFNTTLALAVISFLAFNYYGLKKNIFPDKPSAPGHMGAPLDAHQAHDHAHDHDHHHAPAGGFAGFLNWVAHFWQPTPMLWRDLSGGLRYFLVPLLAILFIFLNIVEEVARLLSLSIRLYGNISGEHQVKGKLMETMQGFIGNATAQDAGAIGLVGYGLMALLLWVSSFFVLCIGTLAGFIQAFIFFVLTLSYIAHAVADEH